MADLNPPPLAIAAILNGYLVWKAAHIASKIDEKTKQLVLMVKMTLDGMMGVLARTKKA